MVGPKANGVAVPARAAYSHSASVGNRYARPVFCDSRLQNSTASSQLTPLTGVLPCLYKGSDGSASKADFTIGRFATSRHCSCVTSYLPIQNDGSVTLRCGPSVGMRSSSSFGEPIVKSP